MLRRGEKCDGRIKAEIIVVVLTRGCTQHGVATIDEFHRYLQPGFLIRAAMSICFNSASYIGIGRMATNK